MRVIHLTEEGARIYTSFSVSDAKESQAAQGQRESI